ncbi:MAG TPA: hypothetical protein VI669_01810 [Vicinamibacteria bacterium]
MRPVQYFSRDYLGQCRSMRPEDIVRFVEGFRELHGARVPTKSRLISMRVAEPLLEAFKTKAKLSGVAYQTQIKRLMETWLNISPKA